MEHLKQHFGKWCVWRKGKPRGNGKPSKEPIDPRSGKLARDNKPETFGTYEQAQAAVLRDNGKKYAGLGVLMSSGAGVVCIDIDDCLGGDAVPNEIATWALTNFNGYCEVSQSGNGIHFFMQAVTSTGWRTKVKVGDCSLEIYGTDDTRFIAVTDNKYHDESRTAGIIAEQDALELFAERFGFLPATVESKVGAGPGKGGNASPDSDDETHSDEEILKLLERRNKRGRITRLFAGDLTDYKGDASSADMALLNEIAYYTLDAAQAERIFNASKLAQRDKWQERADYRKRTITKALEDCQRCYWDKGNDAGASAAAKEYVDHLIGGTGGLTLTKSGKLAANIYNAEQVLLRDHRTQGAVGYNLFGGKIEVLRSLRDAFGVPASQALGDFIEADVTAIRVWLIKNYSLNLGKDDTLDAITQCARRGEFNPVTNALNRCVADWDGVLRLGTWLRDYLNVESGKAGAYVSEVGRRWLIGAVARAFQPGCKADGVLILEGAQGTGKSLAIRTLCEAVYPAGFIEDLPNIGEGEETARALRGAWIVELSELTAIQGRAATEHVKAFLSRQEDNGRAPYDRLRANWKRTVSFCGTTNEAEYINDATGGRRYWAVKVGGAIDIERLRCDARQVWGEAVRAYKNGELWHMTDAGIIQQATAQQQERQVSEVWADATRVWLLTGSGADIAHERLSLRDLFTLVFKGQTLDDRPQGDQKRFGVALRANGFTLAKSNGVNRWAITQQHLDGLRVRDRQDD